MTRHLDAGTLKELTLTPMAASWSVTPPTFMPPGVRRVNVSLEYALDDPKFADINTLGRWPQVPARIDAAQNCGAFAGQKSTAVALKGFNEAELPSMTAWCGRARIESDVIRGDAHGRSSGTRGPVWAVLVPQRPCAAPTRITTPLTRFGREHCGPARLCAALKETRSEDRVYHGRCPHKFSAKKV